MLAFQLEAVVGRLDELDGWRRVGLADHALRVRHVAEMREEVSTEEMSTEGITEEVSRYGVSKEEVSVGNDVVGLAGGVEGRERPWKLLPPAWPRGR